ncbi:pseudouridine-5'-phosphate glycosidase [Flavobacterium aciduliphilum]|uniref:Pseudouridine-5'-phosphate glycosidase n=1 Tax=Flavobacterium aciduliphilum TaxID=1101402 RepID=A0A328Y8Y1_9FLAO|nr:pseudouridine-5'-phosphate glycosidase [Flavobacterium aciduliphilum]RAR70060.1 pseudouridine-5'-phosphate glycosidase [Flavobacterium aciduliphilum]
MNNTDFLCISSEVQQALDHNLPIVALESTIISHGMPWPQNAITAKQVEEEVRSQGAVPATIAIKEGKCYVGLTNEAIDEFAQEKHVWKVSLRDMPFVISQKLLGATTVAATMRIAAMAGIKIFATGGIGGVHRGAATTMDISADLTEMGHTNVAVVAAGVKSILDIGLTLEYLETLGVPVVTFNQDEFPSFYSSKSGFSTPLRLDSPQDIASMLKTKWDLDLKGSVLIANPVPVAYEMNDTQIQKHIVEALTAAEGKGIKGKAVTPFLLKYIADHTQGESLEANIALIKNNARLAAQIAVSFVR